MILEVASAVVSGCFNGSVPIYSRVDGWMVDKQRKARQACDR